MKRTISLVSKQYTYVLSLMYEEYFPGKVEVGDTDAISDRTV